MQSDERPRAASKSRLEPEMNAPRKVGGGRRVLGMLLDLAVVFGTSLLVWILCAAVLMHWGVVERSELAGSNIPAVIAAFSAIGFLVIVPLAGSGATLGQRIVNLRPQRYSGAPPSWRQRLVRAFAGSAGFYLLMILGNLWIPLLSLMGLVFAGASVGLAFAGDHRGISGLVARIRVVDNRERREISDEHQWESAPEVRSLGIAVVFFAALLHLGFIALVVLLNSTGQFEPLIATVVLAIIALTGPVTVIFLLVNGALMMRREGRNLGNLLTGLVGVGLAGLFAVTVLAVARAWSTVLILAGALWAITAYLMFLFWAFALFGLFYAKRRPYPGADAVVVLGARIFGTRVPPLLASRLDRGREVLTAQVRAKGDPVLVCSGGQGPGEEATEAAAMAQYLVDAQVDPERIRQEGKSRTTQENLLFSRELLASEGRGERIVVVTNDFHAFRAAIITRELGLTAQVVGARTARYFLPSALVREFIAVLSRNPWPHLLVMILMLGLAGAMMIR